MRVKYIGASQDQINWGNCDDPRDLLQIGREYDVADVEIHSWHTKVMLAGFPGAWFPSVAFDDLDGTIRWSEIKKRLLEDTDNDA